MKISRHGAIFVHKDIIKALKKTLKQMELDVENVGLVELYSVTTFRAEDGVAKLRSSPVIEICDKKFQRIVKIPLKKLQENLNNEKSLWQKVKGVLGV